MMIKMMSKNVFTKKPEDYTPQAKYANCYFFPYLNFRLSSKLFFLHHSSKRVLFHFILHITFLYLFLSKLNPFRLFGRIFFGVGDLCIYASIYKQTISFIGPTQLLFFGYLTFSQLCFHFLLLLALLLPMLVFISSIRAYIFELKWDSLVIPLNKLNSCAFFPF